jgi:hypothetical protein
MSEAEAYREYVDIVRPPEAPRAQFDNFHLVASTCRIFYLRTEHPLEAILSPGYFDSVADLRLRLDDQIHTVAGIGNGPATHALIAVDHVNKSGGDVKVTLLAKYERTK